MNNKSSSLRKPIRNKNGQIAIFVALIFQVLFILFAMSINVGLIVHDKINLQNAVDLAAYYGAQKQAEWLNVMAHQNYQIRQSWKLFSFRYRVLGNMGVERPRHPSRPGGVKNQDSAYPGADYATVCINNAPTWKGVPPEDHFCQSPDFQIVAPPSNLINIAPFNPINAILQNITEDFSDAFDEACTAQGGGNWYFAAKIKMAFRLDQRNRLRTIFSELQNLRQNNFVTLDGAPVQQGVEKTFLKNLTHSNKTSVVQFSFYNSLSHESSGQMLHVNKITPNLVYSDQINIKDKKCYAKRKTTVQLPQAPGSQTFLNAQPDYQDLKTWTLRGEPETMTDDYWHSSLGVEKNPWVMAYVGVKATSAPRQVFAPFGPVQMQARAFAKPFGGRIGPWYQDSWPNGATSSTGNMVDSNLPPRSNRLMENQDKIDVRRMPNYSRYPGDDLGLKSNIALSPFQGSQLYQAANIRLQQYNRINSGFADGRHNDILAYDYRTNKNAPVRQWELSAIAPDLFDISYYSIMPNYSTTVIPRLINLKQSAGLFENVPLRGDLGSRFLNDMVDVSTQIGAAASTRSQHAYHFIESKDHLFTGWAPKNFNDYGFPDEYFASCDTYDEKFKVDRIPNGCITGGRSGYSVKMVSRDFLMQNELQLGGPGQTGPILNPPPDDF